MNEGQGDGERAAVILAELVNRKLGASATAEDIKDLIRGDWHRLSGLAHAVHNVCPPRRAPG